MGDAPKHGERIFVLINDVNSFRRLEKTSAIVRCMDALSTDDEHVKKIKDFILRRHNSYRRRSFMREEISYLDLSWNPSILVIAPSYNSFLTS